MTPIDVIIQILREDFIDGPRSDLANDIDPRRVAEVLIERAEALAVELAKRADPFRSGVTGSACCRSSTVVNVAGHICPGGEYR